MTWGIGGEHIEECVEGESLDLRLVWIQGDGLNMHMTMFIQSKSVPTDLSM